MLWDDVMEMEEARSVRLKLGPQGRIVVPAHFRRELGLEIGDALVATVQGNGLVIESLEASLEGLRARFDDVPEDVDLVGELLAERREEARREAALHDGELS